MIQILLENKTVLVDHQRYFDGTPRIQLYTTEYEPLMTVTINLSGYGLNPPHGHAFIKNHSENEGILKVLVEEKVVEDTGKLVTYGRDSLVANLVKLKPIL